jgi:hypothetical protein
MVEQVPADPIVEAGSSLAIHMEQTHQFQAEEVVRNLLKLVAELRGQVDECRDASYRMREFL